MRQTIGGSLAATRHTLGRLFFQRCFYLFVMLLTLIAVAPFIEGSGRGAMLTNLVNTFVILAAVAAVGRSTFSFVVVLCLAAPAVAFRWLSIDTGEGEYFNTSLKLHAGVYVAAIALLLRYVFDRAVMTADRLWGAAASFLMIGVLWTFLYAIIDSGAEFTFAIAGKPTKLALIDSLYFSFSTVTTTGFGDIVPLTRLARIASILEAIIGQLFIAILIARLVGVYPSPTEQHTLGERSGAHTT